MSRIARALLTGLVDYAGLFPPAGLGMPETVTNFRGYRHRSDAWALGRLVVPVNRLGEFELALAQVPGDTRYPISALIGDDLAADGASIERFNSRHQGISRVESLEVRVASVPQIEAAKEYLSIGLEVYCELPLTAELPTLVTAVKRVGLRAKVRTGGVKAVDIPPPEAVLAFLATCATEGVAFKATAGLHHPLRGSAPLTYEPDAPCATMFGYLNLILAASLLWNRRSARDAFTAFTLPDRDQIRFSPDAVDWAGIRIGADEIERTRREFMLAIGSCSFTEPMAEIRTFGLDPDASQLTANAAGNRTTR